MSISNHQNISLYSQFNNKSDLADIRKCVILFYFTRLREENCGSLSRILVSTEKTRRHHCATSNPRRKNGRESVNVPITGGILIFFFWRNTCYSLFIIACHLIPPNKYRYGADSALSGDLRETDLKLILISHYLYFN